MREEPDPLWESRVDHLLRALWARTPAAERPAQLVSVFIRSQGAINDLRTHGVVLRSVVGGIAVATITLADLPRIASLRDISYIEASHGLGPDPTQRTSAHRRRTSQ
jgi:hypothetical protein